MPINQVWNYVSLLDTCKELIAANPRIAFYIFILCIAFIVTQLIVWWIEFWFDKFRPDLPYMHSQWIKAINTEMWKLAEAIIRIESKLDKVLKLPRKWWKKSK